ncbi:PRPH2 [Mytilus edulis]|uniref:PRPH2 n=1 Tax=Mytilus edulis TaxID=6550 RepID=A0A8S3U9C2_MYTED|nr:PRPH2 [Mytilus edulis]
MCITIDVDEDGREKLGLAGTALGGILAFFGFILMILAGFIKINIDDKLVLMRGYDPDVLPSFLLTVGIIMFVTNLVMAKVCYDSGYPETRGRFQNLLILFLLYLFVIIWFIFAASMLCFSHSSEIKDSLKDGITKMMNVYHNEPKAKLLIDRLQLDYHCCGSEKHEEWYAIGWMNMKYININNPETKKKLVEGKVVTDSVPFSCCDYLSPRPCIHHDIKDDNLHKKNTDTLSKRGCTHILMNFFDNVVLLPSGYAILMAFFVQQKERDTARIHSYIQSKNIIRALPFSGMRNSPFIQYLDISNVLKTELKSVKQKIFKEKNTNLEQQKCIEALKIQLKNQQIIESERDQFKQELENLRQQKEESASRINVQEYVNQIQELQEQLIEKDGTVKMVQDLYYLRSTEFTDEIQSLKNEKQALEKEKADLCSKVNFQADSISQLTFQLQDLNHELHLVSRQNQQRPNNNNRHYNNRRGGRFR